MLADRARARPLRHRRPSRCRNCSRSSSPAARHASLEGPRAARDLRADGRCRASCAAALVRRQGAARSRQSASLDVATLKNRAGEDASSSPSIEWTSRGDERQRYFVPLAARARGRDGRAPCCPTPSPGCGAARAWALSTTPHRSTELRLALVDAMRAARTHRSGRRRAIRFQPGRASSAELELDPGARCAGLAPSRATPRSPSATRMILKLYRRLQTGIHPELEVGRFLTEVAGFQQHAGPPGRRRACRERRHADGARGPAALRAQPGRRLALHPRPLKRELDDAAARARERGAASVEEAFGAYLPLCPPARPAHRRAAPRLRDADRRPGLRGRAVTRADLRAVAQRRAGPGRARPSPRCAHAPRRTAGARAEIEELPPRREAVPGADRVRSSASPTGAVKTRIHGDYHLGQVLIVGSDVMIVDFEGEPSRPARRAARQGLAACATSPACCAPSTTRPRPSRARWRSASARAAPRVAVAAASWQRAVDDRLPRRL